ncbi:MAG TPA: hypothetical protein VMW63_06530 [Methanoregulaceae archaeon]|nr:hypothetical protein [Methanoregulaceae archaeon]
MRREEITSSMGTSPIFPISPSSRTLSWNVIIPTPTSAGPVRQLVEERRVRILRAFQTGPSPAW